MLTVCRPILQRWLPLASVSRRKVVYRSLHSSSKIFMHENPLGLPKKRNTFRPPSRQPPVKQRITGIKKIIMIASGKGGVGKSTVSTNLAISLSRHCGLSVGLLDADIYGPSIPRMMKLNGVGEPRLSSEGNLIPMSNYGIKTMSIGYLLPNDDAAIVWRGLLVQKVVEQLLFDVEWGELDVLVVDMPPGTGDIQLAITQLCDVSGCVIVSTSQDIALIDAMKCMTMLEKVKVPVLGLVENMSYFSCPKCNHTEHIFGSLGVLKEAERKGIDILGSIPLNGSICELSDSGVPVSLDESNKLGQPYHEIAQKVKLKIGL